MVSGLLNVIESNGIRIEILLLDGGFYSAELIRYLNSSGIRFIIHAPQLRKQCDGKEIDRIYTTKGHRRRKDQQASFRIVSIYGRGKKGVILYIFATNADTPPLRVLKFFKKRWGIETGYRMIRKFLARTTTKIWRIRLMYFYLAVLLYNLWVLLNMVSDVQIIADNVRVFVASILIRNNPFVTNPVPLNGCSGGDF